MQTYLALLRGVNVGAANRIKMEELRRVLEADGFSNPETYIQSGNILFESGENEPALTKRLEALLETSFGYRGAVVLRAKSELDSLMQALPFSSAEIAEAEAANTDAESLYVCLYPALPGDLATRLKKIEPSGDLCLLIGREAYLLLRQSIRLSKLAGLLQKPNDRGTVRNWNTMLALHKLAQQRG